MKKGNAPKPSRNEDLCSRERPNLRARAAMLGNKALSYLPVSPEREGGLDVYGGLSEELRIQLESSIEKSDLKNIINKGIYRGKDINEYYGKGPIGANIRSRKSQLIEIMLGSQEAAEAIVDNNVVGFHGTSSYALAGMIKHGGLMPARRLRAEEKGMASGERAFAGSDGQRSISFADWKDIDSSIEYSWSSYTDISGSKLDHKIGDLQEFISQEESPERYKQSAASMIVDLERVKQELVSETDDGLRELMAVGFPVLVGVATENMSIVADANLAAVQDQGDVNIVARTSISDVDGEFQVFGSNIGLEELPVIAVPAEWVARVKTITNNHQYYPVIVPIEDLQGARTTLRIELPKNP